jgi:antagonist of KipI
MEVTAERAGMMTTVQDLGRRGHLSEGVAVGGAVDTFSLRVANLLVGNPEDAPALEVTLIGPSLRFSETAWVAACGARFEGVPPWRPFRVEKGELLAFGPRMEGCRAYLAVAGGFEAESVLGGRGTFLPAAFGGYKGRSLRDGDVLRSPNGARGCAGHWAIDERVLPRYSREPTVRVMPGSHAGEFGDGLAGGTFTVTARSNRMGIRLSGPGLRRTCGGECVSTAVGPGTIQVPPDGNPIILMADAQTLGGYPRVAHVAGVDLPLLAQLAPGDHVRFEATTVAEAQALLRDAAHRMALLRQGLREKVRQM